MGNLEGKQGQFKWIEKYELIDMDDNDHLLKLMSRAGESEYFGKEYACYGEDRIREMEKVIDKKVLTPCPHLMRLVRVGIKTETLDCSETKIFCLIFQKPLKTLREESIYRKFHNEPFCSEDMLCIL
jgi:hypothetical protein